MSNCCRSQIKGRKLIILNKCKKKEYEIYTINEKGIIEFNPRFQFLYTAFDLPKQLSTCLQCDDVFSILPPIIQTQLVGTLDSLSGFTNFLRTSPVTTNEARQSPIINEGIALDVFYSGRGRRLNVQFDYIVTPNVTSVEVYYLPPGGEMIRLMVDHKSRLTIFGPDINSFQVNSLGLIFFRCVGNGPYTMQLTATALLASTQSVCDIPEKVYFEIDCCEIPLYHNVLQNCNFTVVPFSSWQGIADLVESTILSTQQPIPIAPITNLQNGIITLVCGNTDNFPVETDPDFPGIFLGMQNAAAGVTSAENLWSQYSIPLIHPFPNGDLGYRPKARLSNNVVVTAKSSLTDSGLEVYAAVQAVKFSQIDNIYMDEIEYPPTMVVNFNIDISAGSGNRQQKVTVKLLNRHNLHWKPYEGASRDYVLQSSAGLSIIDNFTVKNPKDICLKLELPVSRSAIFYMTLVYPTSGLF